MKNEALYLSKAKGNIVCNYPHGRYGLDSWKVTAGSTVLCLYWLALQPHQAVVIHIHKAQNFICLVHIIHFICLVSFHEILLVKHLISFQTLFSFWLLRCFMTDPQSRIQMLTFSVLVWGAGLWGGTDNSQPPSPSCPPSTEPLKNPFILGTLTPSKWITSVICGNNDKC